MYLVCTPIGLVHVLVLPRFRNHPHMLAAIPRDKALAISPNILLAAMHPVSFPVRDTMRMEWYSRGSINPHLQFAEHGRRRNIQLAISQAASSSASASPELTLQEERENLLDAHAHSRPPGKGHQIPLHRSPLFLPDQPPLRPKLPRLPP